MGFAAHRAARSLWRPRPRRREFASATTACDRAPGLSVCDRAVQLSVLARDPAAPDLRLPAMESRATLPGQPATSQIDRVPLAAADVTTAARRHMQVAGRCRQSRRELRTFATRRPSDLLPACSRCRAVYRSAQTADET